MKTAEEIWKDLPGYNGDYRISNTGKVWGKRYSRLVQPGIHYGYLNINIWLNGKSKKTFVHRLVAITFIPNPQNKPQVNHKDGNKMNNHVDNLEWCNQIENIRHSLENGTHFSKTQPRGSKVIQINREGQKIAEFNSIADAAKELNIRRDKIYNVVSGRAHSAGGFIWEYASPPILPYFDEAAIEAKSRPRNKKHLWNGKVRSGLAVQCLKCGCVKEIVKGSKTYFLNDTVTGRAPDCDPSTTYLNNRKKELEK